MEVRRKTGLVIALLVTLKATLLASPFASANMLLDRMIVYFEPGKQPRQDIRVTNVSEDNLFLQTEIYKVVNPGAENEQRIRITNPDEMKLLATPQKSIVAPGGRRTVRLVSLETPKETEDVYRITFRPVTGDVEANQNAIQLLIAYQALIFIRPEKPVYELVAKREGDKVTFTNKGNSNVILRNGEQCLSAKDEDDCVEITSGGRIYAGQSLTLDLPGKGKLVRFGMFDGTREQRQEFRL
ncbi:fimbrial biogenesis chaperone [Endozoicomonas euniceicola]|uniref:Fimbria/pilus periplasmic chaperone n=1 Tax=Endozoicomonas euniceicola TaxID=1234143 RepID=A0ABY6GMJ8_9GAMM|nr:fimbria/pilus periplasmic chaperone [Endozoicomonas euniceicola]UYM13926.1 fimbria/pilus periplasmic chaperone [Endozoicomonas euniceicola]